MQFNNLSVRFDASNLEIDSYCADEAVSVGVIL